MLSPKGPLENTLVQLSKKYCAAATADAQTVLGRHGGGETPVPIPNTAVKPSSADGTVPVGGTGE